MSRWYFDVLVSHELAYQPSENNVDFSDTLYNNILFTLCLLIGSNNIDNIYKIQTTVPKYG